MLSYRFVLSLRSSCIWQHLAILPQVDKGPAGFEKVTGGTIRLNQDVSNIP